MSDCKTCGKTLSAQNRSGYCTRHVSAATAKDPAWREKQRNAARMALFSNPERLDRLRAQAIAIGKLPQSIEARRKHCIDRQLWKAGTASQPKGSPARVKAAARQSRTKVPWCPDHLRAEYRRLVNNRFTAAEARVMIEEQHAVDMARFRKEIGAPEEVTDFALLAAFDRGAALTLAATQPQEPACAPREPLACVLLTAGRMFKLDQDEILSKSQASHLMPARYAIAIALKRAGLSLAVIARSLNRVDHSTAFHLLKQGEKRAAQDARFATAVDVVAAAWPSSPETELRAA